VGVPVEFGVLGPLTVRVDGRPVVIGSRKQRVLLAALLVEPGSTLATGALAEVLWDGTPPASADVTLRSLVSRLRRALDPAAGRLVLRPGGYALDVDPAEVDAARFLDLLARGRAEAAATVLREALALWRGPPFAELAGTDLAAAAAARLDEARTAAVEDLAAAELAAGNPAGALELLGRHVTEHPLRERGWELRIRALYRLGRQADALAAYREVRELLRTELGVEPNPALRALQRQVLQQDAALDPRPRPGGDLPVPLTPLVGRARELAELGEELDLVRMLTLTGVGGVGKSRLALALARESAHAARFDDVRLVELAPLAPGAPVVPAVAGALGVPTTATAGLVERLADHLRERRTLLVLDNCEHVAAPAGAVSTGLLARCPGLTVVATSRRSLGVPGEAVWPVPPLPVPPPEVTDPAELAGYAAVELFCGRARAAQAGFGITPGNAAAVQRICRHLDGIPLALELAASRMRGLAAQQVAARLDERFTLLAGAPQAGRQATLQAAMDWSHQLLSAPDRAALGALTVVPATFDLPTAAAVTGLPGPVAEDAVLRLVDRSLVVARPVEGEMRYGLLETVREHAAASYGDLPGARRRYRDHLRAVTAGHRAATGGDWDSAAWHRRAATDADGFRAAVESAMADRDAETALELLGGLWPHWMWSGRAEALGWLDEALAAGAAVAPGVRAQAVLGLAVLGTWWEQRTPERSAVLFTLAAELARQAGDLACSARTGYFHAEFLLLRGDRDGARDGFAQVATRAAPGVAAWCRYSLGWLAMADGDAGRARAEFEAAVEHGSASELLLPHALGALAPLAAAQGAGDRATVLADEAVAAAGRFPLPGVLVMALVRAAQTHVLLADAPAARATTRELFVLLHRLGTPQFRAEALDLAAVLAHRAGDDRAAARWWGAADAVRAGRAESSGGVEVLGPVQAAARAATRDALGSDGWGTATWAGAHLPGDDVVADVLGWAAAAG
jgi:predicted ATPase/DNA-binding SARP family transcriptional activator